MVNTDVWNSDTVLIPVPLKWAPQVVEHLAGLRAGRTASAAPSVGDAVQVPGQGEWSQDMVRTLVESVPYAGVLALFDRCAQVSGTWVIKSEVEQAEGISAIQMRNELGALSKLTKRTFQTDKPNWPLEWKKERGSYYYRMDEKVAAWWTEARGSAR